MRITYDSEVDVLYICFIETTVTTEHVAEGIAVDCGLCRGRPDCWYRDPGYAQTVR